MISSILLAHSLAGSSVPRFESIPPLWLVSSSFHDIRLMDRVNLTLKLFSRLDPREQVKQQLSFLRKNMVRVVDGKIVPFDPELSRFRLIGALQGHPRLRAFDDLKFLAFDDYTKEFYYSREGIHYRAFVITPFDQNRKKISLREFIRRVKRSEFTIAPY